MNLFYNTFSNFPPLTPNQVDKLYLVTNEAESENTLETAMEHPVEATVVLFTSAMFGLNYASARGLKSLTNRRIEHLICVDNSHATKIFWERVSPIICASNDNNDCAQKIRNLVATNADAFFPPLQLADGTFALSSKVARSWIRQLNRDIDSELSWLSTNERFLIIKSIFANRNFVHLSVDLRAADSTGLVADTIDALSLKLDTIYLSNISEIVEGRGMLENFRTAVQCFQKNTTRNTFFVDTYPRRGGLDSTEKLTQRIRRPFRYKRIDQLIIASPKIEKSQETSEQVLPAAKSRKLK